MWNHCRFGSPILRPLWMNYPSLEQFFQEEDNFMLGKNIYVAPIVSENQERVKFNALPGRWYEFYSLS